MKGTVETNKEFPIHEYLSAFGIYMDGSSKLVGGGERK